MNNDKTFRPLSNEKSSISEPNNTEQNNTKQTICRECKVLFLKRPFPTQDEEGRFSDPVLENRFFEFYFQNDIQGANCQEGEFAIEHWERRMKDTWQKVCATCWEKIPNDLTIVWAHTK
jgi:hypothetical protein